MDNGAKTIPVSQTEQRKITNSAIARALLMLAESRGIELKKPRLDLYLEDLADLPPGPLLKAIEDWRRQGSAFFPQVPELRALVRPPVNEDAEAEHAWQQIEKHVRRYYHPDLGFHGPWLGRGGPEPVPPLDRRTERAMRAVGGPYQIWSNTDHGEGT